jgi:hypothetical protein
MADVQVNQTASDQGGGGSGGSSAWILGLLVVVVLAIVLWFVFARGGTDSTTKIDVDINAPATDDAGKGK